jgi:uncharacterized membrane protein
MTAAAWVLYAWLASDRGVTKLKFTTGDSGLRIARALYGLGLIPFGVAHFTYLENTIPVVPAWIPWHLFWAYFTGITFIVAGVAIVVGVCGRLAATLSVFQMGLFTVLIWIPIVVKGHSPSDFAEFVNSWALTASGWMVMNSYRGMRWFGVGWR